MMKISKPVLMNHFMVSHVQFTSLDLVNFKNVKAVYDGNEKILLEFEHPSKVVVSSRDWVGIFPRGWINLQQYVTFEWISQSISSTTSVDQHNDNGEVIKRTVAFCPKYHMNCVNQSAYYQFVYVSKQIEVLGVSSYFRFDLSCLNDANLELECLVPVTGKVRSTSVSDFGALSMTNEQSSTSVGSRKLIHASSIHSLQNLDIGGKLNWSRNFTDDKKNMCLMKRTTTVQSGTDNISDPCSSHSEPVFPMSLPLAQCKKCYQFKSGGDFLKSQQALQSKLKIVMERNKILEERAQEMKKELERLQSESKRMKMSYFNVNKEKVAYENFVKDFIKSLEKDSIVRVMYGNTEILVKKVNYVGMEEHPRDKKTSKRERELKAVIGLQEITIRNLINSLQEKVKSVEELNQTVKLAQAFSAARTENANLGIDGEESADELSNNSVPSECEFSLAKPTPPEEVSGDMDNVLNSIRRTSEMELKNIGITRSLGNNSETALDVANLSILNYDSDSVAPEEPQVLDNTEDCWPFTTNTNKTLRQKLSKDSINIEEQRYIEESELGNEIESVIGDSLVTDNVPEEVKAELETDQSTCENENDVDANCDDDCPVTTIVEKEKNENSQETIVCEGNFEKGPPQEKFNKFTCELSIDFVQRRRPNQISDRAICFNEQGKSEQNLVAVRETETQEYSLERENSMVTFKKSNKCLEIKITKVDQTERSQNRSFCQKMVVEIVGGKMNEEETSETSISPPEPIEERKTELEESPERSDEESGIALDRNESLDSKSESCMIKQSVEEGEQYQVNEERIENRNFELDMFSPRTVWDDANDGLENSADCAKTCEPPAETTDDQEESKETGEEESQTMSEATQKKMIIQVEDEKSETNEQFLKGTCNIQMFSDDSIKNLKSYQDSLRYEKNLQFLNHKTDEKVKESDEETLRAKPSAILIQTGQAKVAVIRYQ
ncbi:UNVERIFIED_CONTAM: hypothetical protein PYX00_001575 [Menopon gallinae]|uniref:SKICH domain-containing protein n=1 Tax=Menopon gallinae TaxID=328185 RepID=A0AAW2IEL7_9NEOP